MYYEKLLRREFFVVNRNSTKTLSRTRNITINY